MEKDTDVIKELLELNQKFAHLEKILEETKYETRKTAVMYAFAWIEQKV